MVVRATLASAVTGALILALAPAAAQEAPASSGFTASDFMPNEPYQLRAEDIAPRGGAIAAPPDFDALTAQARDLDIGLSAGDLAPPEAIDAWRGVADDIARASADRTIETLRRAARETGVAPALSEPEPGMRELPRGYMASLLVSTSLGEAALADLFERYRGRADVRFVFRGVPEDMTVPDFVVSIAEMSGVTEGKAPVPAVIDPNIFEAVAARAVPMVLIEDRSAHAHVPGSASADLGTVVMRAVGISNVAYAFDRFQAGESAYRQGSTFPIVEESLIARAKREAAAIEARLTRDPEELRARFWSGQRARLDRLAVSPATAETTRQLFFAFVPREDIRDRDGAVLAHAGQVFNPADVLPWDRRIWVFDPTNAAEVARVRELRATARPGVTREVFLATRLSAPGDPRPPWDLLQDMVDAFGQPVFLLTGQVRDAFRIRHTPTEIHPERIDGRVEVMAREYVATWGGD